MITFTKEQLIASAHARIEFAEMMLAGELEPLKERTWSIELELARIALASLEAEPVAYMYKDNLHADARFSLHTRFGNWSQEDINEYEITEIPLYTAPPAPVSVPDAIHSQGEKSASDDYYALGWNACRAAMLQGAEPVTTANKLPFEQWLSQQTGTIDVECGCVMTEVFFHWLRVAYEAGNSPVIPDGWVMVPEEPTHEMLEAGDEQFGTYDVYRRMIAASPQQEVKP
ncbi:hypothetical protein ACS6IV_13110 [Enterobacter hormaechei subsp. xiangfangensis]|uniref:hypothetical protein n=1 Tax=Enterobacter hormaechei TaxID=158836 RepID=UPI003F42E1FA